MKKILNLLIMISCHASIAQFIGVEDSSTINRFLGKDVTACGIIAQGSQGAYSCGNSIVSSALGVNVTSPDKIGTAFFMFNDFSYWIQQRAHASDYDQTSLKYSGDDLTKKLDQDFPATWMYMIVFGTSDYLKNIVAPLVTCGTGETLLMGQLKYNDGQKIHTWSQTHVCVSPTDKFTIKISSSTDGSVQAEKSSDSTSSDISDKDAAGVDWMKDPGPSHDYSIAKNCPRSIKFSISS